MFVDNCDAKDRLVSSPGDAPARAGRVAKEPSGETGAAFAGSRGTSLLSCRNRLAAVERVLPGIFIPVLPRKPSSPANRDESCIL